MYYVCNMYARKIVNNELFYLFVQSEPEENKSVHFGNCKLATNSNFLILMTFHPEVDISSYEF